MLKIENTDLYRDGGSFCFSYKDVNYECSIPLYILESNEIPVTDEEVILEIIQAFQAMFEEDPDFDSLMRGRVGEITRYLRTLKIMKSVL